MIYHFSGRDGLTAAGGGLVNCGRGSWRVWSWLFWLIGGVVGLGGG